VSSEGIPTVLVVFTPLHINRLGPLSERSAVREDVRALESLSRLLTAKAPAPLHEGSRQPPADEGEALLLATRQALGISVGQPNKIDERNSVVLLLLRLTSAAAIIRSKLPLGTLKRQGTAVRTWRDDFRFGIP
jgi:hypothetical protein